MHALDINKPFFVKVHVMSRLHLKRLQVELQDFQRGEGPEGISIANASDLEWYPCRSPA